MIYPPQVIFPCHPVLSLETPEEIRTWIKMTVTNIHEEGGPLYEDSCYSQKNRLGDQIIMIMNSTHETAVMCDILDSFS